MTAVIGTGYSGGQTLWTDKVRTALQFDTCATTELLNLLSSSTDFHLCTVTLSLVPVTVNIDFLQQCTQVSPRVACLQFSSNSVDFP